MPHTAPPRRILTYSRVSTQEQSVVGTSLDGQQEQLTAYVSQAGVTQRVDFVEVESGSEKGEERRVEVARLLTSVRPGDVVVVTKFDRFTRNISFAIEKVREIIQRGGRFVSLAEGEFDRTPESEFKLAIWAGVAQMEHARIQDRTRGERTRLRAQGKFVEGKPPFGYKRAQGSGKDKPRMMEIDPPRAALVRQMFQLCVEGWSLERIMKHMRALSSDIRFDPSWACRMFRNRVYTGQIPVRPVRPRDHRGPFQLPAQWVDAHEAIIPMDLFERAQAALVQRRQSHGRRPKEDSSTATWLLRSMVHCGICGCLCMSHARSERYRLQNDGYYVCRARIRPDRYYPPRERCVKAPYVRREEVDAAMVRSIKARLSVLPGLLNQGTRPRAAPNFDKKRRELVTAKQRLVDAVAAGALSMNDILAKAQAIDAQLTEIDIEAREHAANKSADTPENRQAVRAFVDAVAARWDTLGFDERRTVIRTLAERVSIMEDGKVFAAWREPIALAPLVASAYAELSESLKPVDVQSVPALPPPSGIGMSALLNAQAETIRIRR